MSGGALARSLEAGLCLVTPGPADWESQGRPRSPDHTEHRGLSERGERWGVARGVVSSEM